MKVLMALLDEEALAPPCPNKADLLSEDQPVLSGDEANSTLALFRFLKIFTHLAQMLGFVCSGDQASVLISV